MNTKKNFWLECSFRGSNPADDKIMYVDKLESMTQKVLDQLIKAHPNRYSSGIYYLWKDQEQFIQKFTDRKIDSKKYHYYIVTEDFVESLKTTKYAEDDLIIEWFNRITGIKEGDDYILGEEAMKVSANELADLIGLDPKTYPFELGGIQVEAKEKDIIQKFIQHPLDFDKYQYNIHNNSKWLDWVQWNKFIPF